LAEKAGMSLQYLAMLELAHKFPSGEMLERLANALDIETYELLAMTPSANNELEVLRNDIICEVKTLNETLAKSFEKVIEAIENTYTKERRKLHKGVYADCNFSDPKMLEQGILLLPFVIRLLHFR
jgi:transcriptional regulator with XRE-family HTH domain